MHESWPPRVTVTAVVERGGRYLLVEENTVDGLRLNQPSGHLDPGESLVEGVIRETLEETARTFEPHGLLGVYLTRARTPDRGMEVSYLRFAFVGAVGEPLPGRVLDAPVVREVWMTANDVRASVSMHRSPL